MNELIKEVAEKIKNYSQNQIEISLYCKKRMDERQIEESLLISTIFSDELYYVREQTKFFRGIPEKRHKLVFKISSKYSLIVIVVFYAKILKVINVIKTSKGAEKKWRKMISK